MQAGMQCSLSHVALPLMHATYINTATGLSYKYGAGQEVQPVKFALDTWEWWQKS